ncbi:putative GTP cyclohydrolase 1 type 2 [Clostridium tepidiprofundi DSM 19306]|uniref:GTP cyclohydrolase 1 type 2 homolog n=1 Tax=Clostridium tepidiprofundi DSM 19306 TaxID=1121338 RepID=A0A151AZ90_9CLOT|nr:Nif3-like dinuclear metal center hexameric protein [Clostridium tepidiprofundi]KYH32873.1 putative GTP cyclohydrolase 1 type 2 [Clostridium tepidiprofundi DSM 19306]
MEFKVRDFVNIMENYAPVKLKENYDNVGLMVGNTENTITSILVALDCTEKVIYEAISLGCNLILTHHPLLFIKPKNITNETLQGRKIIKLIKNDISLYSAHTNLDSVKNGINDFACKLLGFQNFEIIEPANTTGYDNNSGVGRLINLDSELTLKDICLRVKNAFGNEIIRYSGDENKIIKRIAIINGSGEDYFNMCSKLGVDCIITGDTTYHYVSDITEDNIAVIDAEHFDTEWPALKAVAKEIEEILNKAGYEKKVYISGESKNPYKLFK